MGSKPGKNLHRVFLEVSPEHGMIGIMNSQNFPKRVGPNAYDRFQGTIPKFLQMRLKIRVGFWLFVLYFSKPKFRPDFINEVKNTKNVYFCRI